MCKHYNSFLIDFKDGNKKNKKKPDKLPYQVFFQLIIQHEHPGMSQAVESVVSVD